MVNEKCLNLELFQQLNQEIKIKNEILLFRAVLLFSIFYFIASYLVAIHWYIKLYFSVNNIFFDTDPQTSLGSIASGWGRNAYTHAFLELFSFPIRFIENVVNFFMSIEDGPSFRILLALSISPIFSALKIVFFFLILRNNEIKNLVILTLMFAFGFSNVLFSTIPESYAISSFLITLLFYYYFECLRKKTSENPYAWFILATLLAGITITNVIMFSILYYNFLLIVLGKTRRYSFYRSLTFSAGALAFTLLIFKIIRVTYGISMSSEGGITWIRHFSSLSLTQCLHNLNSIFSALINSFSPTFIDVSKNDLCHKMGLPCNKLSFESLNDHYTWTLGFLLVVYMLYLTFYRKNKHKILNDICLVSMMILLFNLGLHTFFGKEMFLYSQHWITAVSLIIASSLSERRILSIALLMLELSINAFYLLNFDTLINIRSIVNKTF